MAVVDPGEMVEKGVTKKILAIDAVHEEVEGGEGGEGCEQEGQAVFRNERRELIREIASLGLGVECPDDADAVNERVDLEVDAQAEKDTSDANVVHFNRPE